MELSIDDYLKRVDIALERKHKEKKYRPIDELNIFKESYVKEEKKYVRGDKKKQLINYSLQHGYFTIQDIIDNFNTNTRNAYQLIHGIKKMKGYTVTLERLHETHGMGKWKIEKL